MGWLLHLIKLHDLGKIGIPEELMDRAGSLSEDEWKEIKRHPEIGYRIARTLPGLGSVAEEILSHHERWDGAGYPQGLRGKEIPLLSRIAAIADACEAMSSKNAYRKAMNAAEIASELKRCAGTQFDPELVELLLPVISDLPSEGGVM